MANFTFLDPARVIAFNVVKAIRAAMFFKNRDLQLRFTVPLTL
jgi:hypothetical protein